MPKAKKQHQNPVSSQKTKAKSFAVPDSKKAKKVGKKDFGVPKFQFQALKKAVDENTVGGGINGAAKGKAPAKLNSELHNSILAAVVSSSTSDPNAIASTGPESDTFTISNPLDPSLTIRDSSVRAFTRELKKVIDRSDVIIQVLDARDPEGTRSRWVEEEVRKREAEGKRLVAVMNKIDLVPRANLEAWLKHLRHYFPVLPFKSSTQSQRSNLAQSNISLPQVGGSSTVRKNGSSSTATSSGGDAYLPSVSTSLGAPILLRLLKQYAQSRPHQTLTVGIIGYPNVGKSSLINSLKRSRACAVADMPGKTRVIQEVALDKGLKMLDCPGVVLEDFGNSIGGSTHETEDEKRGRLGEVMLRNCVKVEEIEDPIAPVEAILNRVDMPTLQDLYHIPEYSSVTEFLVAIALTKGRLGKGGVADLPAAATTVLRDWNAGKIPFFTSPPKIHPTTAPVDIPTRTAFSKAAEQDMPIDASTTDGDAILTGLGEAFDLEGLFAGGGEFAEEEIWQPQIDSKGRHTAPASDMPLDDEILPAQPTSSRPVRDGSQPGKNELERLFTPAELAVLPTQAPFDRKAMRQESKKRAKAKQEQARREREADEDMFDASLLFGSMSVAAPKQPERPKKKNAASRNKTPKGNILPVTVDAEAQKELEFNAFLNSMGAGDDDMEL